jgi:putative pyruvate formate lyase activating enzyme
VSAVVLHKGEEPVISGSKGICNVFFAHCNLACVFCQNYQISDNNVENASWLTSLSVITDKIEEILDTGVNMLGFVSPSHQVNQMISIIESVNSRGYFPTIVYNSNGYDDASVLKDLNEIVDVYLPDIKYFSNNLALKYSNVNNYFEYAILALKEMIWQKGTSILINEDGLISSGVIVRHLVLPGHVEDSKQLLTFIAHEVSTNLSISLMSQYTPKGNLCGIDNLKRFLSQNEYSDIVETFIKLGFFRGWIQHLTSNNFYIPDFAQELPFKM